MSTRLLKCCIIPRVVRFRKLLHRWRNKALGSLSTTNQSSSIPSDVPAGHIAVLVGASRQRLVIRIAYLNHPLLKYLLELAEEEHGCSSAGLLAIPCNVSVFQDILQFMSRTDSSRIRSVQFEDFYRSCNSEFSNIITSTLWNESRLLLD